MNRTAPTSRVGLRAGLATGLLLAFLLLGWQAPHGAAQKDKDRPDKSKGKTKFGLIVNEPGACKGYTLIASMATRDVYLIDLEGRVVNTWKCNCNLGSSAYLLENGNLLRTGQGNTRGQFVAAAGGRIQEYSWDGKLVWDYTHDNGKQILHHDVRKLPNGNVLAVATEPISAKDAIAAGRRPETVKGQMMADCILEVKPTGKTSGEIVWQWRAWDHLIQEFDKAKANFGDVGKHPERIDVNFGENTIGAMVAKPSELKKLQALGYVGGTNRKPGRISPDWLHVNAVAYNHDLDQVMISVHEFSEIWVIDHGTTTKEAASEKGGKWGKGGGLLYRWGNPRAYRAGGVKDQKLFGQHDPTWIPKGYPGAGNILIFNNGMRRIGGAHSSVDEIAPPWNPKSGYALESGKAYGPEKPVWTYAAPKKHEFYAPLISGVQRLSNGNTLICSGTNGTLFEVTAKKEIVWKYVNPVQPTGKGGGPFPAFSPPKPGTIVPSFMQGFLQLSDEQKKELTALEKSMGEKLEKLLSKDQVAVLKEPPSFAPGSFPKLGDLASEAAKEKMKLSDKQKKDLAALQKEALDKLDKILKDDQKKQFEQMREFTFPKGKGGPGKGGPRPGPGGGGPGFGGPPGGSGLFRAPRYEANFPGVPKDLKPGKKLEELFAKGPPKEPKDRKK